MASKYEFIQPAKLRVLIAESQVDGKCSEELGQFLVRIHDIVLKMTEKFRTEDPYVMEEAKSYSMYRWLKKGLWTIDLEKYSSPFSYIYSGSFLNMLHSVKDQKKAQIDYEKYVEQLKQQIKQEFPSFQVKDLTSLYG